MKETKQLSSEAWQMLPLVDESAELKAMACKDRFFNPPF
jgi:hypothetical protein